MKRLTLLLVCLALGVLAHAADKFWQQLTPEERAAAGLDQLTQEQQNALDQLAARYAKEGALRAVNVAKAEAKSEVEAQLKKREEARIGLDSPKGAVETVSSRISGTFAGWSGKTLFRLENGQIWMQEDTADSYWVPPQPGPEVVVRRSGFGGWKLALVSNGRWVRVKRLN